MRNMFVTQKMIGTQGLELIGTEVATYPVGLVTEDSPKVACSSKIVDIELTDRKATVRWEMQRRGA